MGSRRTAAEQGATDADLARGDSVLRVADALIRQGRNVDAGSELTNASTLWTDAGRIARSRAAAAAAAERQQAAVPVVTPPPPTVPETIARPPAVIDHRPEIERVVAAYAASLETREVAAVRRAYSGLTTPQQRAWEGFFSSVRSLRATHSIASLNVTGSTATAAIRAEHAFVTTSGRSETQTFTYQASLAREGDAWRITSIR